MVTVRLTLAATARPGESTVTTIPCSSIALRTAFIRRWGTSESSSASRTSAPETPPSVAPRAMSLCSAGCENSVGRARSAPRGPEETCDTGTEDLSPCGRMPAFPGSAYSGLGELIGGDEANHNPEGDRLAQERVGPGHRHYKTTRSVDVNRSGRGPGQSPSRRRAAPSPNGERTRDPPAGNRPQMRDVRAGQSSRAALTASTGQVASSRIRWAFEPRMSLPTGVRRRRPMTMNSAFSSSATAMRSSAGSLPRTS